MNPMKIYESQQMHSFQSIMSIIRNPLLVICGCTGCGKSDLAIAIAKKFNGEIINADSMQIYQGLNIATNKVNIEQMDGIPHHLLGYLEPFYTSLNVIHEYKTKALEIIQKIWAGRKLAILVGGTGYYMEAIVFDNNLVQNHSEESKYIRQQLKKLFPTTDLLYGELGRIDPEIASKLHRNNKCRVLRALEIFYSTGKKMSDYHKLQRNNAAPDSHYSATLRFPNTLLINLDATKDFLIESLNRRVDKMMERGLLEELIEFYDNNKKLVENEGVMKSIGPKEFLPYLKLDQMQRESKEGKKKLIECVEMLKIQNRQYAQSQRRWFYGRIINRGSFREIPKSISLNVANDFDRQIIPFSIQLVDKFLNGQHIDEIINTNSPIIMKSPFINELYTTPNYMELMKKIVKCEICDVEIQGMPQLEMHLKGKKHRKTIAERKNAI